MKKQMTINSIAPCGLLCDLCYGFQREKNTCVGCNNDGNKPGHCSTCSIKICPEKGINSLVLCNACSKYPCQRLKKLDKRYREKYQESLIDNFKEIELIGMKVFIKEQNEKWSCQKCGHLICVHKEECTNCGEKRIN